jgi:hypothetical protein
MASVSPTLGPFLLNEFSIVVNIDQPRTGVFGKIGSIAVRIGRPRTRSFQAD